MSSAASAVGMVLPSSSAVIERGRLRFYAEAIGETDARYTDLDAATAAGHPDLPVPPSFFFGLSLDQPEPFGWLTGLGVDMRFVLHGSQRFDYRQLAFAGDELVLEPRISAVYEKRGGALEFITRDTTITRRGDTVATMSETIVVRHPEREAV